MARWSLLQPHYLTVPGTVWEREEVNRDGGKAIRKSYDVPMFLDPRDPGDWNYKADEAIIVCHEGKGMPKDIVFVGDPTPDMHPLDAEAEAISGALRASGKWNNPIDDLPTEFGEFAQAMTRAMEKRIDALSNGSAQPTGPVAVPAASVDDIAELKAQFAQLMEQNAALQAEVGELKAKKPAAERRV